MRISSNQYDKNIIAKALLFLSFVFFLLSFITKVHYSSSLVHVTEILRLHPSSQAYEKLALFYFQNGKKTKAIEELDQATYHENKETNTLGASSDEVFIKIKENEEKETQKELYWENITKTYPDYMDALIQLVYTTHNRKNYDMRDHYLEKIEITQDFVAEDIRKDLNIR